MAELRLLKLKCVKKQQTLGKDRIMIYLDDKLLSGPFVLGAGDEATLGHEREFSGYITIKLLEDDKRRDEIIGRHRVSDEEHANGGLNQEAFFDELDGANYQLVYQVHA